MFTVCIFKGSSMQGFKLCIYVLHSIVFQLFLLSFMETHGVTKQNNLRVQYVYKVCANYILWSVKYDRPQQLVMPVQSAIAIVTL